MIRKSTILAIAIAVIFAFFVGYGIEVFYDTPEREDVCSYEAFVTQDSKLCEEAGGLWVEEGRSPNPKGFCDAKKCHDKFGLLLAKHNKVVFIISLFIGLLSFVFAYNYKHKAISTGLIGGSLLIVLYGTLRYWEHADDRLKFVLLGIALAGLIWFAYKKIR
tara:strand:+ start:12054 stop:12539 length:486 start_codon:yes stop_codon:yes gene_type:complete